MLGWIGVILLVILALAWSWIVVFGNAMSDAPSTGFQAGWTIAVAWVVVVGAFLWKVFG